MIWLGVVIGLGLALGVGWPAWRYALSRQVERARDAERRARRAERLAEIGAMTGGLAHEIKNPLSTIGLNAQLLAEGIGELDVDDYEKHRLVKRLEGVRREADRLRDILQDFLRFAGEVRLDPRPTDLNALVEELVDFYLPQAQSRGVSIRTDLAPGPPMAMLDAPQFKQAVLNLMLNATQAMEPLRAGDPQRPRELILKTSPGAPEDGRATWRLQVIDTGPGIPPETLERIFTPYFTTRSGGTGLGLPTTRRLVEEHAGRIDVHSEVGKGSDFTITVPAA